MLDENQSLKDNIDEWNGHRIRQKVPYDHDNQNPAKLNQCYICKVQLSWQFEAVLFNIDEITEYADVRIRLWNVTSRTTLILMLRRQSVGLYSFVGYFVHKTLLHVLSMCRRAKYLTSPSRKSNPGRWIYRQTLHHVVVKASFYRKAVEVYLYIPIPCDIHPSNLKFVPEFLGTGITWNETKGDIYAQNGHSMGYLRWAQLS